MWEDLVKLRYGERRDDSPFIWNLMENYTKINAWYVEICVVYFGIVMYLW